MMFWLFFYKEQKWASCEGGSASREDSRPQQRMFSWDNYTNLFPDVVFIKMMCLTRVLSLILKTRHIHSYFSLETDHAFELPLGFLVHCASRNRTRPLNCTDTRLNLICYVELKSQKYKLFTSFALLHQQNFTSWYYYWIYFWLQLLVCKFMKKWKRETCL